MEPKHNTWKSAYCESRGYLILSKTLRFPCGSFMSLRITIKMMGRNQQASDSSLRANAFQTGDARRRGGQIPMKENFRMAMVLGAAICGFAVQLNCQSQSAASSSGKDAAPQTVTSAP